MAAVRRFKTLQDTQRALAAFLRAIEKGEMDAATGRVLIYGCSILASIQKDSDLERRLEALETGTPARPQPQGRYDEP